MSITSSATSGILVITDAGNDIDDIFVLIALAHEKKKAKRATKLRGVIATRKSVLKSAQLVHCILTRLIAGAPVIPGTYRGSASEVQELSAYDQRVMWMRGDFRHCEEFTKEWMDDAVENKDKIRLLSIARRQESEKTSLLRREAKSSSLRPLMKSMFRLT